MSAAAFSHASETREGIEPSLKALQASAFPLRHRVSRTPRGGSMTRCPACCSQPTRYRATDSQATTNRWRTMQQPRTEECTTDAMQKMRPHTR